MKISKISPQNNSEIIKNEHDKEIPEEMYIFSEEIEKIIDDLRSKFKTKNWVKINDESRGTYNEHDKEIPKGIYISSEEIERIIDDLRLI